MNQSNINIYGIGNVSSIDVRYTCFHCNIPHIMNKCCKCEQAFYCSLQCQLYDWEYHKKYCKDSDISSLFPIILYIENIQ